MDTPGRTLLVPTLALALIACANGTNDLMPGYEEQAGGGGGGVGGEETGNGSGGDAGGAERPASGADRPASSSMSSAGTGSIAGEAGNAGTEGEGGDGGEGAGGEDGAGEGGEEGGGEEPACDYGAPAMCSGAEALREIAGDVGSDSVVTRGSTSRWFKINIADDSGSTDRISFTARLTSPPGMNFDLFVYQGDSDAPDCYASGTKGTGSPDEVVAAGWNDVPIFETNRWLSIEVRYVSGTACGSEATWTLTVQGNTESGS
ncbi:hypothetical protein WMF31_33035 [Sorangium sp. So ce1036]